MPPHGCDCHVHVFGPAERYPYGPSALRYAPPQAPLSEYLSLASLLGLTRYVFVQPSAYGRDNRCKRDPWRWERASVGSRHGNGNRGRGYAQQAKRRNYFRVAHYGGSSDLHAHPHQFHYYCGLYCDGNPGQWNQHAGHARHWPGDAWVRICNHSGSQHPCFSGS